MRLTAIACAVLTAICTPAIALQTQSDPEAVYKAAGRSAAPPTSTIAYGANPLQVGDLRIPSGPGPYPVAVIIHGGCWRASVDNRTSIAAFADALTKRGVATWNIEYRRVGDAGGGWPGTFQDVAAAVDALVDIAPRYGLDLSRVIYVGHSSGAHMALWAASRPRLAPPWKSEAIQPISVTAIDGPGELVSLIGVDAQVCGSPVIVPLMGGTPSEKPLDYGVASPIDHLPLGLHQLSVEGELGDLMHHYIEATRASGDQMTVIEPTDANHFDIVTPSTPNGAAVIDFIMSNAFKPH